jgi:hypothetical protein
MLGTEGGIKRVTVLKLTNIQKILTAGQTKRYFFSLQVK